MNFVILIRRTEDWKNIKVDDLKNYPPNLKKDKFTKFIVKWNNNMSIDYFSYRQKIKDIAIRNMQDTGIPIVTNSKEFLHNNKNNDNLFVIPTDDDDWLHPNIQNYLEAEIKNDDYISWRTMFCSERFSEQLNVTPSNGYAIRCSKATIHNFLNHTTISNDNRIDKFLSVYLRHAAAIHPVAMGKTSPETMCYLKDVDDRIKWAKPYLNCLNEINLSHKGSLLL